MIGLGTIINVAGIVVGGGVGRLLGKYFSEKLQDALSKACGVSVIFIGAAGAISGMLRMENGTFTSGGSLMIVICLVLGALIGELINIEGFIERLGRWLKVKTGNAKDKRFVDGFVTSSLTVCIGAMAIVGAIQDGIFGDYSVLATKAVLDFVIVLIMSCSMGIGCLFSAIPVGVLEGGVTVLARLIRPIMTESALANLSLVGSILIFCVGVNLVWDKKIRVANLLPALIIAIVIAFLPISL